MTKVGDIVELGIFEVETNELIISDPCYDVKSYGFGEILHKVNAKNGIWHANVCIGDELRCAALSVWHEDHKPTDFCDSEHIGEASVDSGQCGVFDADAYRSFMKMPDDFKWKAEYGSPSRPEEREKEGDFYGVCCDTTCNAPYAGVIPLGAVSSSGWGDGGYPVNVIKDDKGVVVAINISFMADDSYIDLF